ncbi:MAG: ATP-binding domain-containing protein, partial [Aeromicrobium sp.]
YDFAAGVARIAVPNPDLPDAVRRTGEGPRHVLVEPGEATASLIDAIEDVAGRVEGTIAVVASVEDRARLAGPIAATLESFDGRVKLLDGLDTKGLEFDGVIVVEPDAITDESPSGWRTLYVVLTRATQRLTTVGTTERWLQRLR